MTVAELIELLELYPADSEVRVTLDISDIDTAWRVALVRERTSDLTVLIVGV